MTIRCNWIAIPLMILVLLAEGGAADGQKLPSGLMDNQVRGDVLPDAPPVTGELPADGDGIAWHSEQWSFRFDRYQVYRIKIDVPRTYTISLLSERRLGLGIAVIDQSSTILAVGAKDSSRNYRRLLRLDVTEPSTYYIVIGSGSTDEPIRFALQASSTGEKVRSSEVLPSKSLGLGEVKGSLSEESSWFQGRRANLYKLSDIASEDRWIRVRVESDDFDTVICALGPSGDVVAENDDVEPYLSDSEIVLPPDAGHWMLAVARYKRLESFDSHEGDLDYTINVKSMAYDPSKGVIGAASYFMGNPLYSFVLGVIVSLVIAWVWHKKGIRTKVLFYEPILDHTLIAERGDQSGLKVAVNGRELSYASLYKIGFENVGHGRISGDLVEECVAVKLKNVERIVDLAWAQKGKGWQPPRVVGRDTFELPFDYLDHKDSLIVSAICEQREDYESMWIEPVVSGHISETIVRRRQDRASVMLALFVNFMGIMGLVVFPVVFLDSKFRFMPDWWIGFCVKVLPVLFFVMIGGLLLSRRGRSDLGGFFLKLWPLTKRLFRKDVAESRSAERHRLSGLQIAAAEDAGQNPQLIEDVEMAPVRAPEREPDSDP